MDEDTASPPRQAPKSIPATKIHRHFKTVLKHLTEGNQHIIVERHGIQVAALLPMSEYKYLIGEHNRLIHRIYLNYTFRSMLKQLRAEGCYGENLLETLAE